MAAAITSLVRKAGYNGPVTPTLLAAIRLVRYQSTVRGGVGVGEGGGTCLGLCVRVCVFECVCSHWRCVCSCRGCVYRGEGGGLILW